MYKKILFIFGTRPEAIKMAPLIKEFKKYPNDFAVSVCVTAQHRQMLDQVLDFFNIKPQYDLDLMKPNQTLFDITANILKGLEYILDQSSPDLIFVQGDTTTVLAGALAGYYKKIKIAHLEAGLRSGQKHSPFPEEINRIITGHIADYHFAPTEASKNALAKEGIVNDVYVVGNTVVDALLLGLELINDPEIDKKNVERFSNINFSKKIILVTGHRRESFGKPFENICDALMQLACNPELEIVYPVHLNPNVQEPVYKILKNVKNVHLIEPLDYKDLIWIMNKAYLVLTDSGGIQEEAPSLGKPVIVMRDVTERMEGVSAGTAVLVGTDAKKIIDTVSRLVTDQAAYNKMSQAINPYGDGLASSRIVEVVRNLKSVH